MPQNSWALTAMANHILAMFPHFDEAPKELYERVESN